MSQAPTVSAVSEGAHPLADEGTFLDRYSPNHELLFSSITSFAFHFLMIMLIPLLAAWAATDRTPPEVDVVHVAQAGTDVDSGGLPGEGQGLEENPLEAQIPLPAPRQPQELQKVTPNLAENTIEQTQEELARELLEAQGQAVEVAAAAASKLRNAQQKLNDNLGKGGGGGSGAGSGRPGRAARWVLRFNTKSAADYLAQFESLGAELAFPTSGDRWRFFSNLTKKPPTSSLRDLSSESRIYWTDDDAKVVADVCRELGIEPAPFMIAFLPVPLEQKMLELELAYEFQKQEDDIEQTVFVAVPWGNGYKVEVLDQTLKKK